MEKKPAVANLSLGGTGLSNAVNTAVQNVINSGIHCVISAGNDAVDACGVTPANVGIALTIAASDINDVRANFSNFGSCVDIFAPGVNIVSIWGTADDELALANGTSMSAPFVTGVIALMLERNSNLQPSDISNMIISWATNGTITDAEGSPNALLYSPYEDTSGSLVLIPSLNLFFGILLILYL